MEREEAIHELQNCKGLIQQDGQDYLDERDIPLIDMAIEALQNEETLKTQLANCHKEILRLLDFNDITESPNDDIEPQNDVIEVVRCKDCKWYMLTDHNDTEICTNKQWDISMAVYPIISENDFCSRGERSEP